MKLIDFYNKAIEFGAKVDPRKNLKIDSYADTAILYGQADRQIRKVLVGIDIESSELLLADRIREKEGLDLVLAHHPEGACWAALYDVMQLQVDLLEGAGIPRIVAQKFLDERKREVERRVLPNNHMRSVDAARLLDLPFMCVHTPADNHASYYIDALMRKCKPSKVGDIVDILKGLPEYKEADKYATGPRVILGSPHRKTGKIFVEMTGGTEGSKDVFDKLYEKGIRTLVSMHLSEEHFKKVKEANLNVVIAGHISSDTLGLNLLLDKIERQEKLSILTCSGFKRFKRDSAGSFNS